MPSGASGIGLESKTKERKKGKRRRRRNRNTMRRGEGVYSIRTWRKLESTATALARCLMYSMPNVLDAPSSKCPVALDVVGDMKGWKRDSRRSATIAMMKSGGEKSHMMSYPMEPLPNSRME